MIGNILLGDLEQNNFSPKVNFQVFLFLNVLSWSRDMSREPKILNEGNWRIGGEFTLFPKKDVSEKA